MRRAFVLASLLLSACSLFAPQPAVDLRTVPGALGSARVERSMREGDAVSLANELSHAITGIETVFGHTFNDQPKVVFFSSSDTFALGTKQVLGYSNEIAAMVANRYGAIFDRDSETIAVNGAAVTADRLDSLLTHELTHNMAHQLSNGADLPVWFDEGLATRLELDALPQRERWPEQYALAARAVALTGRTALGDVTTLAGWHDTFGRIGAPLYSYAWQAEQLMEERVGWAGVVSLLGDVAGGATLADAYAKRSGETLAALEARLKADVGPIIVTKKSESGDAMWSLFTAAPRMPALVTIAGQSTYVVTFTVETDEWGVYRGTFGSTAPRGTYRISGAGASATIDTRP